MKFNTNYLAGIGLTALLALNGCDKDFEETNSNPNSPEAVSSDLLLPNIIRSTTNEIAGKSWGYGNLVMQQTAKIPL